MVIPTVLDKVDDKFDEKMTVYDKVSTFEFLTSTEWLSTMSSPYMVVKQFFFYKTYLLQALKFGHFNEYGTILKIPLWIGKPINNHCF